MMDPPVQGAGPDELTERYRRASAADASRPGEAVRTAIAAQARTAAAAHAARSGQAQIDFKARAANDSHWPLRAAAGLAVVAIGALIAFRIGHHAQPEPASAYVVTAPPPATPPTAWSPAATAPAAARGSTANSQLADVTEPLAARLPTPKAEQAPMPAIAAVDRPAAGNTAASAERSTAPAVAPALASAQASAMAPGPAAVLRLPPPSEAAADAGDAAAVRAIIAQYFPAASGGADTGLSRWVLLDHAGRVLRTGRGPVAGEPELRAFIERQQPGVRIVQFRTVRSGDGMGGSMNVVFAWGAAEPPAPGP